MQAFLSFYFRNYINIAKWTKSCCFMYEFDSCSAEHSTRQPIQNKLNEARDLRIFRITLSALLQQLHRAKISFLFVNFVIFYFFQFIQTTSVIVNIRLIFQPICKNEWTWEYCNCEKIHGICVVCVWKEPICIFCYTLNAIYVCFVWQFDHLVVCRCHIAVGIILLFNVVCKFASVHGRWVYM